MELEVTPEARNDIRDAIAYYNSQALGLGDQFDANLQAAARSLLAWPKSGRAISDTARKKKIKRFPYALLYGVTHDRIVVYRVIHLVSDPKHWLG